VLVHLWEDYGPEMLQRLRGMFAIAVLDSGRQALFLARDRLGKKPLYWSGEVGGVTFASELKALRVALPPKPTLERRALGSFLRFGFVPEGQCILAGVHKLPPAHWLRLDLRSGEIKEKRYWGLELEPEPRVSFAEAQRELVQLLRESVRLRLRSDVPLGVLLSGGLDSGTVACLAAREAAPLRAISATFGGAGDELRLARANAVRRCGSVEVRPEGLGLLPRMAEVFDEPLADPSCIPTYLVAREARRLVKVVLNGDGGDEGLAGYRRFLAARLSGLPGAGRWGPAVARFLPGFPPAWRERLAEGLRSGADPYLSWGPVKFTRFEALALLGGEGGPEAVPQGKGSDAVNRMRAQEIEFFPGGLLEDGPRDDGELAGGPLAVPRPRAARACGDLSAGAPLARLEDQGGAEGRDRGVAPGGSETSTQARLRGAARVVA
jgi:asparagine synthase (glutamine-hydrolysing)